MTPLIRELKQIRSRFAGKTGIPLSKHKESEMEIRTQATGNSDKKRIIFFAGTDEQTERIAYYENSKG